MTEQLQLGEQAKTAGIELIAEHNEDWLECAIATVARLAKNGSTFSVDELRLLVDNPPNHANAWGAVFSIAARQGLIERVGYQKSTTPSAHARVVAVWRGKR